jgi:hypothetical protein
MVAQFVSNGARTAALAVPLTLGLIWALRKGRIPWRMAAILMPVLFISIGLMSAIRTAGYGRESATQVASQATWGQSFAIAQKEIEERRSLKAQIPIAANGFAKSGGPLLGRSYEAALFAFIPRVIWDEKPRGPDSLYAQLFLRESREGQAIPVTPTAEMFWNFGLPGVVVLMIFYGWLLHAVHDFYERRSSSAFVTVFYVLFLTTFQISTERLVEFEQKMLLLGICYFAIGLLVPKRHYLLKPLAQPQLERA